MKTILPACTLALPLCLVGAAHAYDAGSAVSVNIINQAFQIAQNLKVDIQDVRDIGSVRVPIDVAANVCNVQPDVLATAKGAACDAKTTNKALNQIVQQRLNARRR